MLLDQDFKATGYNTTVTQPHFINPECFGEDVAAALRATAAQASPDLEIGDVIQEDYGWGFWIRAGADPYWVGIALIDAEECRWRLIANHDPGFNLWKRWFGRPDPEAAKRIRRLLLDAIPPLPGGALLADTA